MARIIFCLSLFFSLALLLKVETVEKQVYEQEIEVIAPECLQLAGEQGTIGSRHALRFYNTCPVSVYANVCVEEQPGKFRLHKSASKIPKYGNLTIYTHEGAGPASVSWKSARSGMGKPLIPDACLFE